jgi:hypothetical protein
MEKVIEGWEWRELIEENLEKIIEDSNMSQECKRASNPSITL